MRGHQLLCFRGGKRSLFMQRLVPFVYAYIWRVLRLLYRTLAKLARSDATFNALCGKSEWLFGLQRGLILSLQNTTVSQKRNKIKLSRLSCAILNQLALIAGDGWQLAAYAGADHSQYLPKSFETVLFAGLHCHYCQKILFETGGEDHLAPLHCRTRCSHHPPK